jgi:hypothetical protein
VGACCRSQNRHMSRRLGAVTVALALCAGCGSSAERGGDQAEVEQVARAFAHAVDPEANPGKLCALLSGKAREQQGCGTEGEDIGPLLQLAIDSERDVRVVRVEGDAAVVHIPSIRMRNSRKGEAPSQVLRLRKLDGKWKFTELELTEPAIRGRPLPAYRPAP